MKAVVAAFNQEKALVGAFSVITNLRMELFVALPRILPPVPDLTASTLQETQTGLMTGLVDFILKNAPFAKALPDAKYDDYFR